jgi:membrane AbrB-like protein
MNFSLPSRRTLLCLAETMALGTAGGAVLGLAGLPAGWLSGSIIVVAIAAVLGRPVVVPPPLAKILFTTVGISLGAAVTPESLQGIGKWPLSTLALCFAMFAVSASVTVYLHVVHGWKWIAALFASSPGALSQTLVLALEYKCDVRAVAVVQTVRVVAIAAGLPLVLAAFGLTAPTPVTVAPAITSWLEVLVLVVISTASAILAYKIRFPGGLIVGAMIASGALHGSGLIHTGLPTWIAIACFVGLGALTGSRFAGTEWRRLLELAGAAVGAIVVGTAVSSCLGVLVAALLALDARDLVIAYAPGGLEAMIILSLALHLDTAFVGAHHLVRFVFVSFALPLGARLLGGRPPPRTPAPPR